MSTNFTIDRKQLGLSHPTYFIADISANHDGDLERAKALIHLAAASGADAAKFQNFRAKHIVSDRGFRSITDVKSHQSNWEKSVYEVYHDASLPWDWTPILFEECQKAGISYFSTPYDLQAIDMLDPYVPAYKIGSGDITWPEICLRMAQKNKPILLATGASTIEEVQDAVSRIQKVNHSLCIMQCNTNYSGSLENFRHIHLRVLETYKNLFPNVLLGLSDHTPGHATVLGAVTLGARAIEKHFSDDTSRAGPDHAFSMTPETWRDMVDRTRELECALGSANKEVADNEKETRILQRRCLRATRDLQPDTTLGPDDVEALRPAPADSIYPFQLDQVIGRRINTIIPAGEHLQWSFLC